MDGLLPEADGREDERQRHLRDKRRPQARRAPAELSHPDRHEAERQVEEEHVHGALVRVDRPQERDGRERQEHGERASHRADPQGDAPAAQDVVQRRQCPGREDAVQRQQEPGVVSSDVDRDPDGGRDDAGDGEHPRHAVDDGRRGGKGHDGGGQGDHADGGMAREQRPDPVDRRIEQAGGEPQAADRPRQDADPADVLAAGHEQRAEAGRSQDGRRRLTGQGHAPARF